MKRNFTILLALLLALCTVMPVPVLAGGEDGVPGAYTATIHTPRTAEEALDQAMATQYLGMPQETQAAAVPVMQTITEEQLAAYAQAKGLTVREVRRAYYAAMVVCLQADITLRPTDRETVEQMKGLLRLIDRDRELDDWFDDWEDVNRLERLYGDDWDDRYDDDWDDWFDDDDDDDWDDWFDDDDDDDWDDWFDD